MNNLAFNTTKAIGYLENGGKPDIKKLKKGKTGELKSIFQYKPETWKAYAKEITGNENLPINPDNEILVTQGKVDKWLKEGLTLPQIFSSWNAGPAERDAYTGKFSNGQPSVGVNKKYGVKYDVPGYVKKGMSYLEKFQSGDLASGNEAKPQAGNQSNTAVSGVLPPAPVAQTAKNDHLDSLIGSLIPNSQTT